jgi:UDP-N-acetylmuramyl pentapeptide phosphotransferase/UDP-N-acetylglucosamine-1-phosphate transferase
VVIDQPILFHKPNKKVRSEKKMDHFISQTKHTIIVLLEKQTASTWEEKQTVINIWISTTIHTFMFMIKT